MNDAISRSAMVRLVEQSSKDAGLHYADAQKFLRWLRKAPALDVAPDLNTLRDAIYEDACAHGLWDDTDTDEYLVNECHSMIEEEVDELYDTIEDWVNGFSNDRFIEELADVIIMALSVAGKLGIDIDAAVHRKMEFNKGRPWRHEEK